MRQALPLFFFLVITMGIIIPGAAQVVTVGPDSVKIPTPPKINPAPDTTNWKPISQWSPPAKAAFYSAVLPGLGQAYNKSYWKIPLVYATGAVIGYFIYDNNRQYQSFARAIRIRSDGDSTTVDQYVESNIYGIGLNGNQGILNLRRSRDFFRKYRDLDIILAILAWGLNIMEAHVDAHLRAFDVSEDLSLRLQPTLQPLAGTSSFTAGLTLHFNLK